MVVPSVRVLWDVVLRSGEGDSARASKVNFAILGLSRAGFFGFISPGFLVRFVRLRSFGFWASPIKHCATLT